MVKRTWRLVLCGLLWSSSALCHSFDLRGDWRMSPPGDNPAWALPDFDDSHWGTLRVPWLAARQAVPERYWIRRTVQLRGDDSAQDFAITIGALSEFCEVYVNGAFVGRTNPFDIPQARLARPHTFDIPAAVQGPRLQFAIRVWYPRIHTTAAYRLPDNGPWLLTDRIAAPREASRNAIRNRQFNRLPDFIQAVVLLAAAGLVALLWLGDRRQRDTFCLLVYMLALAGGRILWWGQITEESQPLGWGVFQVVVVWGLGPALLLAQFVASAIGPRWLAPLAWLIATAGATASLAAGSTAVYSYAIWTLQVCTLAGLAVAALRPAPGNRWQGNARWLLLCGVLLVFYGHGAAWGRWASLGLPNARGVLLFGTIVGVQTTCATLFTLLFVLSQVRSVVGDRVRLATEFEAARTMQQLLFPDHASGIVDAVYRPATEVGGDFWQHLPLADGSHLVAIGDVSGKGLKAAMMVSLLTGALRNRKSDRPAEILAELNKVAASASAGGFTTAATAHIDGNNATIASAGHPAPFHNGGEVPLEPGLPLGVDPDATYSEQFLRLEGQLTFVSDGVIEAANANGELFGFDRTRTIAGKPAKDIAAAAQAWGQNDDVTVVTVQPVATPGDGRIAGV